MLQLISERITDARLKLHAIVQQLQAAVGIIDAVITHVQVMYSFGHKRVK